MNLETFKHFQNFSEYECENFNFQIVQLQKYLRISTKNYAIGSLKSEHNNNDNKNKILMFSNQKDLNTYREEIV
jgi:hypothetical protein